MTPLYGGAFIGEFLSPVDYDWSHPKILSRDELDAPPLRSWVPAGAAA